MLGNYHRAAAMLQLLRLLCVTVTWLSIFLYGAASFPVTSLEGLWKVIHSVESTSLGDSNSLWLIVMNK